MFTEEKPYYTLNDYYHQLFGEKVYKIPIDAGFTCPTRDGSKGVDGCIFCSCKGSGDFIPGRKKDIYEQIEAGKTFLQNKYKGNRFIAYFQAFTNTYGPLEVLEQVYKEALQHPDIVAIAIGTRPDCLSREVIKLLDEVNRQKKVFVELGLQTIHEASAVFIRRGYPLSIYDEAVSTLKDYGIETVVHLILGLLGETKKDMLASLKYAADSGVSGIKLHMLQVLKKTDLGEIYLANPFPMMSLDEYADLICDLIQYIPKNIIIHR